MESTLLDFLRNLFFSFDHEAGEDPEVEDEGLARDREPGKTKAAGSAGSGVAGEDEAP